MYNSARSNASVSSAIFDSCSFEIFYTKLTKIYFQLPCSLCTFMLPEAFIGANGCWLHSF